MGSPIRPHADKTVVMLQKSPYVPVPERTAPNAPGQVQVLVGPLPHTGLNLSRQGRSPGNMNLVVSYEPPLPWYVGAYGFPQFGYKALRTILRDFSLSAISTYSRTPSARLRRSGCARPRLVSGTRLRSVGSLSGGGHVLNRAKEWQQGLASRKLMAGTGETQRGEFSQKGTLSAPRGG